MLDRDPAVTPSPAESVNLLPGVSKNINAGNVFKKAVRAVGILRRIQMLNGGGGIRVGAAMPNGEPGVQVSIASRAIETPDRARPNPVNLSLHDVVSAAMIAKQSGIGLHTPPNGEQDKKHVNDNSEEYLAQMDAVLESLTN
jgi:calcium/calmodulin-dependent protein kinase I